MDDLEALRESMEPRQISELRGLWSDMPPSGAAPAALPKPPPLPTLALAPAPRPEEPESSDASEDPDEPEVRRAPLLAEPARGWREMLAAAPEADPDTVGESIRPFDADQVREPDRVDMDHVVGGLWEPSPRQSSSQWVLPLPASPKPAAAAPLPSAEPASGRTLWLVLGVGVLAYLAGLATPRAGSPDPAPARLESRSAQTTREAEQPFEREPVAVEPVAEELEPVRIEPAVVAEPVAERVPEPRPLVEPIAPAPVVERIATQPPARVERENRRLRAPPETSAAEPERAPAEPVAAPAETPREPAPVEAREPDPNLPPAPDRAAIQTSMDNIADGVRACGDTVRGHVARVRFTFVSSGRPTHTIVSGVTGDVASCVARAARTARVEPFSQDRFVVEYPFTF